MGNRAVIAFDSYNDSAIGIYLHWNGGRDSIEGFLEATRQVAGMEKGGRGDKQYNRARLIENICIFFGGNLSVGIDKCANLDCDNYDNGVYVVDTERLEIIGRHHFKDRQEQDNYDIDDFAALILKKLEVAGRTELEDDDEPVSPH